MLTAITAPGPGEWVFQKGDQGLGRDLRPDEARGLPQKAAGCGLVEGAAGAVVGHNVPPQQRSGHAAAKCAIRRDQGSGLAGFDRLAQRYGDGVGLLSLRRGLYQ